MRKLDVRENKGKRERVNYEKPDSHLGYVGSLKKKRRFGVICTKREDCRGLLASTLVGQER